jgi:hypothetical protein
MTMLLKPEDLQQDLDRLEEIEKTTLTAALPAPDPVTNPGEPTQSA